jgi:hypothetical protein
MKRLRFPLPTLALISLVFTGLAHAQVKPECNTQKTDSLQNVIKQATLELNKLTPSKTTKKGFKFIPLSDPKGHTDETTGITWLSKAAMATHEEALAFCKSLGAELPSKKDYKEADAHGIREIYTPAAEGQWASSKHSGCDEIFKYDGSFGYQCDSGTVAFVRCIKKP